MQNSTANGRPRKSPLSDAERERVNRELAIAAIEQLADEAPPREPRLKSRRTAEANGR
jgi:hypothetical protein